MKIQLFDNSTEARVDGGELVLRDGSRFGPASWLLKTQTRVVEANQEELAALAKAGSQIPRQSPREPNRATRAVPRAGRRTPPLTPTPSHAGQPVLDILDLIERGRTP